MAGIVHKVKETLGGGNNTNTETNNPAFTPTAIDNYGSTNQTGDHYTGGGYQEGGYGHNTRGGNQEGEHGHNTDGGYHSNINTKKPGFSPITEDNYDGTKQQGGAGDLVGKVKQYLPGGRVDKSYGGVQEAGYGHNTESGFGQKIGDKDGGRDRTGGVGQNDDGYGNPGTAGHNYGTGDYGNAGGKKESGMLDGIKKKIHGSNAGYNDGRHTGDKDSRIGHTGDVEHIDGGYGHTGYGNPSRGNDGRSGNMNDDGFGKSDGRYGQGGGDGYGGVEEGNEGGGGIMDKIKKIPCGGAGDQKATRDATNKY